MTLSDDPEMTVTVPLTATEQGGATAADYSGVPASLTFNSGDTEKEFTFGAEADEVDDDGESVKLGFGALPDGVTAGDTAESTVSITDDDKPASVTVNFDKDSYTVAESGTVTVKVTLSDDPEMTVTVPLTATEQGGATTADYSGVPASLTFNSGDTEKTFTFGAEVDDVDDGESVKLAFGTLPAGVTAGVTAGDTAESTVSITDDDAAGVTITPTRFTVLAGESNQYTVVLGSKPTSPVTVTVSGHSGTDLSVNPSTLTFSAETWDMPRTVAVTAIENATAASVTLEHAVSGRGYAEVTADDVTATILVALGELNVQVGVTASQQGLTVQEGGSDTYSVVLSTPPADDVTVAIDLPSGTDLSIDPSDGELTFTPQNWNSAQTVTVKAAEDDDATADELVIISHTVSGGGYDNAPAFSVAVTIMENGTADVTVSESSLTIDEGGDGTYTVKLKTEPTGEVVVTVNDPSNTDVTAEPGSLTFTKETWNNPQPVIVSAKEDDDDTVDEAATVTHTVSGADYEDVTAADVGITVIDNDDPQVTVSFGASAYTAAESGTVEVTIALSTDPEREVVIPLTTTEQNGASGSDYSGVPASVTFESGDTEKTFTFEATDDALDDDGESVKLGFGAMPTGVTVDTTIPYGETQARDTATVSITDDDKPASVTVNFDKDSYTVAEGGTVTVKVTLSDDPEMTVTVPLTATEQGGATAVDYSSVPSSLTFNSGDTEKEFTFGAEADDVDDDGESVKLGFGTLPAGVASGDTAESTVAITDDDDPQVTVSFGAVSYAVAEGGTVEVTITLSTDPEREVVIPLTKYGREEAAVDTNFIGSLDDYAFSATDYSGVPESVTFESGDTSKTFTFEATDDTVDDDGESVKLGFGALPAGVTAVSPAESTVSITDDDKPASVTVNFDKDGYTAAEGGTVTVKVTLSDDPEMTVTVPLTATEQGGATAVDYSGVPSSLTFNSGDTEKEFTFGAEADEVDDDGESVKLAFGALPAGVASGDTAESTVSITDNDDPQVTVSFGASSYTAAEGGTVEVTIALSTDPEREVVIPLTTTEQNGASGSDYSGVPASVTFESGDTGKTFTFEATDDALDDDGESVKLGFGALPDGVTAGDTAESTVSITDDDKPASVTVNFDKDSYTVAEGGTVTVKVTLSDDPEMTVTVPLTATEQDGATSADYSGVPESVTFESGETEKEFTFGAEADEVDDDGESIKLAFGALPAGVTSGDTAESTVSITDNDDPQVTVSFGASSYTAAEGGAVEVTVTLSADPEREVVIPLTTTNEGGATGADYSDVPESVTFESGDTEKTFTFEATDDALDDDGESVKLGFGALPDGVTAGDTAESTVSITDDDKPVSVTVNFDKDSYTVAESGTVTVKVTLSDDPEMTVTVPLTATEQDGATTADYSDVPASLTFNSGDTEKEFTFGAEADEVDDDGESVKLGFGTLPAGVTSGATAESTVSITDDDDPQVKVSFGAASYTVAEGGTVEVTITLSADPEREVVIPLTKYGREEAAVDTNFNGSLDDYASSATDYSGVPESVTFESGDTEKTFTFEATDDALDDDGESVKLTFGTLPDGVTAGDTDESTVSITDDDDPQVTVSFGSATYSATEGGDNAEVTVRLSVPAPSQVDIPLTAVGHYKATPEDWLGVPTVLTFDTGDTSKSFTLVAFDDTVEDNGEMVELGFGSLPEGFTTGSPATARVTLMNDDTNPVLPQDCVGVVWCATLGFADKSSEDWGYHHLEFHRYSDPPSSLSSETFTFEEQVYTVVSLSLTPGSIPGAATDSYYLSGQGILSISIHMGTWEDQLKPIEPDGQGQWPQDRWTLYFDDIKLPFPNNGKHIVVWTVAELYSRFMDWAPGTTHKLRIVETVAPEQSAITVPGSPERLVITPLGGDALLAEWSPPTYDGGAPVTGYRLQWKAADGDWGDPDDVDEARVGASRFPLHIVYGGLATGVEYTLRVIATNEAGDGEPSDERSAIPQLETPHVRSVDVSADIVSLTYDRPLDTESIPATSAFEAYVNGGLRNFNAVAVEGYTVTLTLASAVSRADQVSLRYIAPLEMTDAGIQDTDGYKAWSSSHSMITNTTEEASVLPLTAEFRAMPASHNGEDSFTFYIDFSEPVWVGQGTASHSTLEVAGGSVTSAWWMDRNTSQWQIVVQPDPQGPVTIILPAGRDCKLAGVPCASGERSVSHRVELTVPGSASMNQISETAPNRPATGGPSISGTPSVGETLTATTSQIADEDGLDNAAFAFQWIRSDVDTGVDTAIEGATGSTYTVTSEDDGHAIKVRVTFTDDAGNEESLTSYAVLPAPALPEEESSGGGDTTPPQLSAAAVDGATLTLTYDEGLDGDSVPAVDAFEVMAGNDTRTVDAVSVADSTVTLTLASVVTSEDAVTVSYTTPAEAADPRIMDIAGNAAASYSGQVVANDTRAGNDASEGSDEPEDPPPASQEEPAQNTLPEGRPAITGTAQVGETLSADITGIADADGLDNADFTYQWLADDAAIQGATSSTYTPVDADAGRTIKVRVTFTDDAGYEETLTSAATDEVDAAAPPLSASLENAPDSHDGENVFTFELRFSEEFSLRYVTLRDHAFTVVGGSLEKVQRVEKPSNIRWRITVRPDGDGQVVITLPATTDCAADGAICTEDGRKLSNRLGLTVNGPGK